MRSPGPGLPRETGRRKLASLIEAGVSIKDAREGVRLTPGALRAEPFVGAVARTTRTCAGWCV